MPADETRRSHDRRPARLRRHRRPEVERRLAQPLPARRALEAEAFGVTGSGPAGALRRHRHRPLAVPHRRPAALPTAATTCSATRARSGSDDFAAMVYGVGRQPSAQSHRGRPVRVLPVDTRVPRRVARHAADRRPGAARCARCSTPAPTATARVALADQPDRRRLTRRDSAEGRHDVDVEPARRRLRPVRLRRGRRRRHALRHRPEGREVRADRRRGAGLHRLRRASAAGGAERLDGVLRGQVELSINRRAGCPRTPRRRTTRPRSRMRRRSVAGLAGRRSRRLGAARSSVPASPAVLPSAYAADDGVCSETDMPGSERLADSEAKDNPPSSGCTCSRRRRSRRQGREGRRHRQRRPGRPRHRQDGAFAVPGTPASCSPATARSSPG